MGVVLANWSLSGRPLNLLEGAVIPWDCRIEHPQEILEALVFVNSSAPAVIDQIERVLGSL